MRGSLMLAVLLAAFQRVSACSAVNACLGEIENTLPLSIVSSHSSATDSLHGYLYTYRSVSRKTKWAQEREKELRNFISRSSCVFRRTESQFAFAPDCHCLGTTDRSKSNIFSECTAAVDKVVNKRHHLTSSKNRCSSQKAAFLAVVLDLRASSLLSCLHGKQKRREKK